MEVQLDSTGEAPGSAHSPRLSVIVPVHNDPQRLAKCLDALAGSTFRDFEIIVADDGSTDGTHIVAENRGVKVLRLPRKSGAAAARNAGAEHATGEILVFIDADVCVHPDTLAVASESFNDPTISAIFGSYDLEPAEPNILSQYKNLAHRYYHQISDENVTTFWSGCGAMRRDVFNAYKFDTKRFTRPSIEDIDLGARLTRDGKKIIINKQFQAKHMKHWSMVGIWRSDIFDRAIPWTRLILREKSLPGDLNLSTGQRGAALLSALSAAIFLIACVFKPWLAVVPLAVFGGIFAADKLTARWVLMPALKIGTAVAIALGLVAITNYAGWWSAGILLPILGVVLLNVPFYEFFVSHRGLLFTTAVLPMHLVYYLYSIGAFLAGHAIHYGETIDRLDDFKERLKLYAAIAAVLYIGAWSLVLVRSVAKHTTIDFAVSDATGYYAYLPSLVIDHDLNFDNQMAVQYPVPDIDYANDMQHNRWPIGVTLSIAPAFLVAHVSAIALHHLTGWAVFAPHGYSPIYYFFCIAWIMALGLAGMIVADKLIVERFAIRGRTVAAAIVTTWLSTNYVWYFAREPLLAHMAGATWVIFSVYLIHRIDQTTSQGKLVWWHLPMISFCTAMAIACRMTNGFIAPMFIYLAINLYQRKLIVPALKLMPLIVIAAAPLAIHFAIMKAIQGQVMASSMEGLGYGPRERFYWTHPALLRSLFSSRHGLFFATPTLLLAGWGLVWHIMRRRGWRDGWLMSLIASAIVLWYVNASWYAWWFGPSVGNRGYVELAGLYAIGFAFLYTWMETVGRTQRRIVLTLLALFIAFNYVLAAGKLVDFIDDNQYIIPAERRIFTGRLERI
ncbi:MAG TPA: glycosyltransferase family 2 protein [Tepidisphaeraceae bacterium]|nr:glycosyltransferase family 2 protein [Tepidisphaeraceae bacterium]